MNRYQKLSVVLVAWMAAATPIYLSAEGPCEDLCAAAAVDLIVHAGWTAEMALKVAINCVKGCSVP